MPIIVNCSYCGKDLKVKPFIFKKQKTFSCSVECMAKLRETMYLGENNPNCKYKIDRSILDKIDNEYKAYFLGFVAGDGSVAQKNVCVIQIHKKDRLLLEQIQENLFPYLKIVERKPDMVCLSIYSQEICNKIREYLNIELGPKDNYFDIPNIPEEFFRHFIRGWFDADGTIRKPEHGRVPECKIACYSTKAKKNLQEKIKIKSTIDSEDTSISFSGVNCIDFLSMIYDNANIFMSRKKDRYYHWSTYVSGIGPGKKIDNIKYIKTNSKAIAPNKENASDSGYDLTLVTLEKQIGDYYWYNTHIKLSPPMGWYFDIVPRSSIVNLGYILANNVGVIDRSYVGEIKVVLIKINKNLPDLVLPNKCIQAILRPIIHFPVEEVTELSETTRGSNGFGSTGQ